MKTRIVTAARFHHARKERANSDGFLLTVIIILLLAIFGRIDSGFKERSRKDAGNRN